LERLKAALSSSAVAIGRAEETLGRASEIVRASMPRRETEAYSFEKGWFNQYDDTVEIMSRARKDAAPGKDGLSDALIDAVRSAKPRKSRRSKPRSQLANRRTTRRRGTARYMKSL